MVDAGLDPTLFDLSGHTIRITEGVGSAIDLTSSNIGVTSLDFQNIPQDLTPDTIKIQYRIEYHNPGLDPRYDYSKTFYGSASLRY